MTKTHQANAGVFIFNLLHELADFGQPALGLQLFEHLQARFVGAAVSGPPQASHTRAIAAKGLVPDEPHKRTVEVDAFCS